VVDPFDRSEYVFLKYAGAVEVFDGNGNSVLYAEREGVNKIGKPIHVYTSKYRTKELLTILPPKGRKELAYAVFGIIPQELEYRVVDVATGEVIGCVVQRSKQRITKDDWILTSGGIIVGKLKSRRYILHSMIWPRKYEIIAPDGRVVGRFRQHRTIISKYTMEIADRCIDTRLLVAVGIIVTSLNIYPWV